MRKLRVGEIWGNMATGRIVERLLSLRQEGKMRGISVCLVESAEML